MENQQVIIVQQKPVITYDLLEKISGDVSDKIRSLNIETLEPTEDNLSEIKRVRADLNNDFKTLEEQRKMVKDIVLAEYNRFEDQYKTMIAAPFKNADATLKGMVDQVTDKILQAKIDGIVSYFDETNVYDFVRFEDLQLKIIKSRSDKSIREEIDEYFAGVRAAISTIETLQNKDRVMAKFQITKDLNRAISEVNIEIDREEQIRKQKEEREQAAEAARQKREEQERAAQEHADREASECAQQFASEAAEPLSATEDETVYKCTFAVYATKAQLTELKNYMKKEGIRYE